MQELTLQSKKIPSMIIRNQVASGEESIERRFVSYKQFRTMPSKFRGGKPLHVRNKINEAKSNLN